MRKVNAKRTAKPTSHAVLTNWKTLPPRARYILTVSGETRPSYAAIQLEDGWLIVQL
jgi:hypothetical protein